MGWYVTSCSERSSACANLSLFGPYGASRGGTNGKKAPEGDAATVNPTSSADDGGACVFTSLKPAWADRNLYNLAEKVCRRLQLIPFHWHDAAGRWAFRLLPT